MKTVLTDGLNAQEKKEVEQEFASSLHLRRQVIRHLEKLIEADQRAMRDITKYEQASWAMYQADRIGRISAYEKLITLFS